MIPNQFCAITVLSAWIALILVLLLRAVTRKRVLSTATTDTSLQTDRGVFALLIHKLFESTHHMRDISNSLASQSDEVRDLYRRFRFLTILAVVLFGVVFITPFGVGTLCAE